ncbi:MAG: fibronectin type III domain-containing protein [Oligoflexales bacterium]|nr:fibronectin type III domain-containing protein [Oligoflexales bacterium]
MKMTRRVRMAVLSLMLIITSISISCRRIKDTYHNASVFPNQAKTKTALTNSLQSTSSSTQSDTSTSSLTTTPAVLTPVPPATHPVPIPVPATPPPPQTFSIVAAVAGDGFITLTWENAVDAEKYTVLRGTVSGNYSTTLENLNSPYKDQGLTNGTAYYYKVIAVNTHGKTDAKAEVSATPLAPTVPKPLPGPFSILSTKSGNHKVVLTWGASQGQRI